MIAVLKMDTGDKRKCNCPFAEGRRVICKHMVALDLGIFPEKEQQMMDYIEEQNQLYCQTAHCGRHKPHFDFGVITSPIVPYRNLPQTLRGMTADCRSLV